MTSLPTLVRSRSELRAALDALRGTTALVMTMGALHDGHLELVRQARQHADNVVVTIFVNPTQFAPGEDFEAYPRTLEADMGALATVGADLVWAPPISEVYPHPSTVIIDPGPVAHHLEGATRPTHFAGVALVVTKVILLVAPDVALFGEKDAQQLAVIRRVVADLDIPVRIVGVPIVRDTDGVALSSRNQYLSPQERERARALSRALTEATQAVCQGATVAQALAVAHRVIAAQGAIDIDYIAIVDDATFEVLGQCGAAGVTGDLSRVVVNDLSVPTRILVAAKVGTTRLIDNMAINAVTQGGRR
ncbi:pantoate--beta-alanine ligase [Schaalia suimastitidis]|uniref:pantoate--beta-alanine ligase n=1 Tax=Schaalia suimastitidis TaxID=121163 RepID=UPI0003F8FA6C|nr:pantoate--beta-alanine ligase [Schaalia suimastitidis]